MSQGWVSSWRRIKDWEWYKVPHMAHLFQHLIREANHSPKNWRGQQVNRGQLLTGRKVLSAETGIPEQTIRTCLRRLRETGEISVKSTSQFTIITICHYGSYQPPTPVANQRSTSHLTNDQPADQPQTISKEYCQNSKEFQLSSTLLDLILLRKPDYRKPNLQTWAKHIDRMIRLDKRTPEQTEAVIQWCQQDTFWQNNILSTEKLRKQFDQLELKMKKGYTGYGGKHERHLDEQESEYGQSIENV